MFELVVNDSASRAPSKTVILVNTNRSTRGSRQSQYRREGHNASSNKECSGENKDGLDGLKAGRNSPVAPSAQSGSGRNQQLKLKPAERKKRHNGGNYEWSLARGHGQSPPLYGA